MIWFFLTVQMIKLSFLLFPVGHVVKTWDFHLEISDQILGGVSSSGDLGIGVGLYLFCSPRPIGLPMNQKNIAFCKCFKDIRSSDLLSVPYCFEDSLADFICFSQLAEQYKLKLVMVNASLPLKAELLDFVILMQLLR
jgi:hypothetical protein